MENKETKNCPYCGEEILAIAKKCKHCGEFLDKKLDKKKKKETIKVEGEGCFLQTLNIGCMITIGTIIAIIIVALIYNQ